MAIRVTNKAGPYWTCDHLHCISYACEKWSQVEVTEHSSLLVHSHLLSSSFLVLLSFGVFEPFVLAHLPCFCVACVGPLYLCSIIPSSVKWVFLCRADFFLSKANSTKNPATERQLEQKVKQNTQTNTQTHNWTCSSSNRDEIQSEKKSQASSRHDQERKRTYFSLSLSLSLFACVNDSLHFLLLKQKWTRSLFGVEQFIPC